MAGRFTAPHIATCGPAAGTTSVSPGLQAVLGLPNTAEKKVIEVDSTDELLSAIVLDDAQ